MNDILNSQNTEALMKNVNKYIFQALIDAIKKGDNTFIEKIGISDDEYLTLKKIALKEITVGDIADAGSVFNFTINRRRLNQVLARLKKSDALETLIKQCMAADAPNQFFHTHFGMHNNEIAELRKRYQSITNQSSLSDQQFKIVEKSYHRHFKSEELSEKPYRIPNICLSIFNDTRIPIRQFYKEFFGEGE